MSRNGIFAVFFLFLTPADSQDFIIVDGPNVQTKWQATLSAVYEVSGKGNTAEADRLMDQVLAEASKSGPHSENFSTAILQGAAYFNSAGLELKADTILSNAIAQARRQHAEDVRTQLESALANQYVAQGKEMKGLALYREMLARPEHAAESPSVLLIQAAWAAERAGDLDQAEKWIKQASEDPPRDGMMMAATGMASSSAPMKGMMTARFRRSTPYPGFGGMQQRLQLAQFYERYRRFDEAEKVYTDAIENAQSPADRTFPLQMYSQYLLNRKRFQEAAEMQMQVIAANEAVASGSGSSGVDPARQNLAQIYLQMGNFEAANKLIEEQVTASALRPAETGEYFSALTRKAEALTLQKDSAGAEATVAAALEVALKSDQPYQRQWAYSRLAEFAEQAGDPKKAEGLRNQANEAVKDMDTWQVTDNSLQLMEGAHSALNSGATAEAVRLMEAALSALPSSRNPAVACNGLYSGVVVAQALANDKKEAAADSIARRVLQVAEEHCSDRPNNMNWQDSLINYYLGRGLPQQARVVTAHFAAVIAAAKGENSPGMESVLRKRIEIARSEQDEREVSTLAAKLLQLCEENHGAEGQATIQEEQNVAVIWTSLRDFPKAEELWGQALHGAERLWGGTGMHANLLGQIGEFYIQTGNYGKARDYLRQAISVSQQSGDGPPTDYFSQRLKEIDRLEKQQEEQDRPAVLPEAPPSVA